jgi:hypothetical protein
MTVRHEVLRLGSTLSYQQSVAYISFDVRAKRVTFVQSGL